MAAASVEMLSAGGILSLLDENDIVLQEYAVKKLDSVINEFWAEIANSIEKIISLSEDKKFSHCEQAALLASKVYYHLGEYDLALSYLLKSGNAFQPSASTSTHSEYVETMMSKCIDGYIALRTKQDVDSSEVVVIDSRLEELVEYMFSNCLKVGKCNLAIGMAVEAKRTDIIEKAIRTSFDKKGTMEYVIKVCNDVILNRQFRNVVLKILVNIFLEHENPDYGSVVQCLVHLNDVSHTYQILKKLLVSGDQAHRLIAYQISFDIYEDAPQHFTGPLRKLIANDDTNETPKSQSNNESGDVETAVNEYLKLGHILSGELTEDLYREFLYRNKNVDLLVLNNIKKAVVRNLVCHSAAVICHAYLLRGTTDHSFLKQNLEWLGRASNWAKFSATSTLGVIHQGHIKDGRKALEAYLPKGDVVDSVYSEGGSLFALGLINANHGQNELKEYFTKFLQYNVPEIVHGACLGVGTAFMASGDIDLYDELSQVLHRDDAVMGESAAISIGLLLMGTGHMEAAELLYQYGCDTQHEKIIRGVAWGIAMIFYGLEEEVDGIMEKLSTNKDPLLRSSAMHCIALAYIGSANHKAILKLLHFAVSDVNDDVRRSAVSSIGYLLFKDPTQCPPLVSLFAESYNPHVRYGAAMALGVSCAGTGLKDAIDLLDPLTKDPVDFVRQGAAIALSMILIQQNAEQNPYVQKHRSTLEKSINSKHEETLAKFGSILAQGILDAGGRNVTISLASRTGHTSMKTAAGLFLFQQHWYWYPLANFLSLAFTPTSLIALNKDLKMPTQTFECDCSPSMFAYPPMTEVTKEVSKKKVSTAVLSVSSRGSKKKVVDSESKMEGIDESCETKESMDVETEKPSEAAESIGNSAKLNALSSDGITVTTTTTTIKNIASKVDFTVKEQQDNLASSYFLENPCRVTKAQTRYIKLSSSERFQPIKKNLNGIIIVDDTKIGQDIEFVQLTAPKTEDDEKKIDSPNEAPMPEPFDFETDKEDC